MKTTIFIGAALLVTLTACSNGQKNFRYMTAEELHAYNQGKTAMNQVVCEEKRQTSSRIRKKVCMPVRDIINNKAATYQQLGVINTSVPNGVVNRGR